MQYSVSPRFTLSSLGPNPSENVSTRTPMRLAIRKWPSSCTKMSTPRTNRNATMLVTEDTLETGLGRRLYSSCRSRRELAGPAVDPAHLVQTRHGSRADALIRVHRLL